MLRSTQLVLQASAAFKEGLKNKDLNEKTDSEGELYRKARFQDKQTGTNPIKFLTLIKGGSALLIGSTSGLGSRGPWLQIQEGEKLFSYILSFLDLSV